MVSKIFIRPWWVWRRHRLAIALCLYYGSIRRICCFCFPNTIGLKKSSRKSGQVYSRVRSLSCMDVSHCESNSDEVERLSDLMSRSKNLLSISNNISNIVPLEFNANRNFISFPCSISLVSRSEGRSTLTMSDAVVAPILMPFSPETSQIGIRLIGEISISQPAYLNIVVNKNQSHYLYISQFGLTSGGSITQIDLNPKIKGFSWHQFLEPKFAQFISGPFLWPNEIRQIPKSDLFSNETKKISSNSSAKKSSENIKARLFSSAPEDTALLVADGFLMPGKADGGVYIVLQTENHEPQYVQISGAKRGWFYHKAVWIAKPDGRKCILAARATKPLFGPGRGELVIFDMPLVALPLADYAIPWRETILVNGPDVMFQLVDLDPSDSTVEVFASEFFSRKLTMHSIKWGNSKLGTESRIVQSWVLDDNCGPAYSVVAADLLGAGHGPTHLVVTSHECLYDNRLVHSGGSPEITVGDKNSRKSGGALFAYEIPNQWQVYPRVYPSPGWKRITIASGFRVKGLGINPGAPGFSYVFHPSHPPNPGERPYIALAGDCSQAAYIFRPSDEDVLDYELACTIECEGTVGTLAISHGVLGGNNDGRAKLFVPNYDHGRVYIFSIGEFIEKNRYAKMKGVPATVSEKIDFKT